MHEHEQAVKAFHAGVCILFYMYCVCLRVCVCCCCCCCCCCCRRVVVFRRVCVGACVFVRDSLSTSFNVNSFTVVDRVSVKWLASMAMCKTLTLLGFAILIVCVFLCVRLRTWSFFSTFHCFCVWNAFQCVSQLLKSVLMKWNMFMSGQRRCRLQVGFHGSWVCVIISTRFRTPQVYIGKPFATSQLYAKQL